MARSIEKVLIGNNWQGTNALSGTAAIGNPVFTGQGATLFTPPAPAAPVDIAPGGITAFFQHTLNRVDTGAPPFNPATAPTGTAYFMINFAMYDAVQGRMVSDPIRYDQIRMITGVGGAPGTPFEQELPQITLFHLAYPGVLGTELLQGESVDVLVDFNPDFPGLLKQPIVTSYKFPGNVNANAPVTAAMVQYAHWVIMENILAGDVDRRLFDHDETRRMSTNFAYKGVFLVGRFKRVYQVDNFQQDSPYKFIVSIRSQRQAQGYPNVQEDPTLVGENELDASFASGRAGIFEYLRPRQGSGNFSQVNWHWTENLGYRGHYQSTTMPFNRKPIPINDPFAQFDRFEIEHWNLASSPSPISNDLTNQRLVIYVQRLGASIMVLWNAQGANSFLYGSVGVPFPSSQINVNPFIGPAPIVSTLAGVPGIAGNNDSNPNANNGLNWNVQLPFNNAANAATPIGGVPPVAAFTPAAQGNSAAFSGFLQAVANYMFT